MSAGGEWTEDAKECVREALADRKLKGEARVEAILSALGMLEITEVYPRRAHAEIERVEVYGLEIGIDANGYATRVAFPLGADT